VDASGRGGTDNDQRRFMDQGYALERDSEVLKMTFKDGIQAVYYYQQDNIQGVPFWKDKRLITLIVSTVCMLLAKWAGINIDSDLQATIVAAATGVAMMVNPGTGIAPKPKQTTRMDTPHGGNG
jgi:hypothetical protein